MKSDKENQENPEIPSPRDWVQDYEKAQARYADAVAKIYAGEVIDTFSKTKEWFRSIKREDVTTLKGAIKEACKVALFAPFGLYAYVIGMGGALAYDSLANTCREIKEFIRADAKDRNELIEARCNKFITWVKASAQEAAVHVFKTIPQNMKEMKAEIKSMVDATFRTTGGDVNAVGTRKTQGKANEIGSLGQLQPSSTPNAKPNLGQKGVGRSGTP